MGTVTVILLKSFVNNAATLFMLVDVNNHSWRDVRAAGAVVSLFFFLMCSNKTALVY